MTVKSFAVPILSICSLLPVTAAPRESAPIQPAVYNVTRDTVQITPVVTTRRSRYYYRRRHARRKTIKRVGIGAAGGAAIGAIAGGGPGAAIGAIAGGGAGALYDAHEKHKGR